MMDSSVYSAALVAQEWGSGEQGEASDPHALEEGLCACGHHGTPFERIV